MNTVKPPAPSKLYLVNFWLLVAFLSCYVGFDLWFVPHGRANWTDLVGNVLVIAAMFGASAGKKWWYLLFRILTILVVGGVIIYAILGPTLGHSSPHPWPLSSILLNLTLGVLEASLMASMLVRINARWSLPTPSVGIPPATPGSKGGGWASLGQLSSAPKAPVEKYEGP